MMCTYKFLTQAFSFPLKSQMMHEVESYSSKVANVSKASLVNTFKVSLITNFSVLQNASVSAKLHVHTMEHQVNTISCFPHIKDHNTDQMVYAQLN